MKRGTYFTHPALLEGLPVLGEGCTGLSLKDSPLDLPPNAYISQVITEARSLRCTAIVSTNMVIQNFLGHEGVSPASIEVSSDQSHRNTSGDTTSDFTVLSAPIGISKSCSKYSCNICGKKYSQRQGVSRHRQSAHNNPHSCLYCDFEWTRPYMYTKHLKMRHPDVNADEVLGKPAGSRCKSTIIGRDLDHYASPLAIEPDPGSLGEPRQRPLPPVLAETKVTYVPSSTKPLALVVHNPQFKLAEPRFMSQENHENAHGLEPLGTADAPSAFLSPEECVQSMNDFVVSIEDDQTWSVHLF